VLASVDEPSLGRCVGVSLGTVGVGVELEEPDGVGDIEVGGGLDGGGVLDGGGDEVVLQLFRASTTGIGVKFELVGRWTATSISVSAAGTALVENVKVTLPLASVVASSRSIVPYWRL
jgi:hypothetical protein